MPQARQTGKTTKLAITAIANALNNPNQVITVKDHYNTQLAHKELCNLIKNYVDVLQLKHFVVNPYSHEIKYQQPNQTYIELYEQGKALEVYNESSGEWEDCDPIAQGFPQHLRFRIKPEAKRWVFRRLDNTYGITECKYYTEDEAQACNHLVEIIGEYKCKN